MVVVVVVILFMLTGDMICVFMDQRNYLEDAAELPHGPVVRELDGAGEEALQDLAVQGDRGLDDAVAGLLDLGAEALQMPAQDGAIDALEVTPAGLCARNKVAQHQDHFPSMQNAKMNAYALAGHGAGEGGKVPLRPLADLKRPYYWSMDDWMDVSTHRLLMHM